MNNHFKHEWSSTTNKKAIAGVDLRKSKSNHIGFYKKPTLNLRPRLKVKSWRKMYHATSNQKKAGEVLITIVCPRVILTKY